MNEYSIKMSETQKVRENLNQAPINLTTTIQTNNAN